MKEPLWLAAILLGIVCAFLYSENRDLKRDQDRLFARVLSQELRTNSLVVSARRAERRINELRYNEEQLVDQIVERCLTKKPMPPLWLKGAR